MNEKREQIILSAIKLFGKKGFRSTSIQEIANLAGISKGAVYLHFQSKEEIICSIYNHYFELTRRNLTSIQEEPNSTPQQKLEQACYSQLQLTLDNRDFLLMQFNEGILANNDPLKESILTHSLFTLEWLQMRIKEHYGTGIHAHSLDCASMVYAILKEYIFYIILFNLNYDMNKLSSYIVERLDDLVNGLLHKAEESILSSIDSLGEAILFKEREHCLDQLCELRKWIESKHANDPSLGRMIESLNVVAGELQKEPVNEIILIGMYNNLKHFVHRDEQTVRKVDHFFVNACKIHS